MRDVDAIYERRRQRRMQKHNQASYYDPMLDIFVSSTVGTAGMHELAHYLDHTSTSYGFFVDRIFLACVRGWGQLFHEIKTSRAGIPCPLYRLLYGGDTDQVISIDLGDWKDGGSYWQRMAITATSFDILYGLCEAMDGTEIQITADVPALSGLGLLERISDLDLMLPTSILDLEDLPVWTGPENIVPIMDYPIGDNVYKVPIGARALYESRAMIVESALKNQDNAVFFNQALDMGKPEYVLAMHLLADRLDGTGSMHLGFSTFLALSDLALMTPAAPDFCTLLGNREWKDVHPGYRYLELLSKLDEIGPYHTEQDPFEYQAEYCRQLGWPEPSTILECAADLPGNDRRTERFKHMCTLKLENPECFFVGRMPEDGDAFNRIVQIMDPIELTQEPNGSLCAITPDKEAAMNDLMSRLGESYYFDLGECFMEYSQPIERSGGDWLAPFEVRMPQNDHPTLKRFFIETLLGDISSLEIKRIEKKKD